MSAPADAPYRSELESAAQGLVFSSGADHPFEYFFVASSLAEPLTIDSFRTTMGIPTTASIDERPLDAFLSRHIERVDPTDAASLALVPRYQQLKDALRETLNGPAVFCVGQVSKRCYLAGTDARGNVVGLVTTAMET